MFGHRWGEAPHAVYPERVPQRVAHDLVELVQSGLLLGALFGPVIYIPSYALLRRQRRRSLPLSPPPKSLRRIGGF